MLRRVVTYENWRNLSDIVSLLSNLTFHIHFLKIGLNVLQYAKRSPQKMTKDVPIWYWTVIGPAGTRQSQEAKC